MERNKVWLSSPHMGEDELKFVNEAGIGAGSVVIEDVPDYALVVDVPGKIKKFCKPAFE